MRQQNNLGAFRYSMLGRSGSRLRSKRLLFVGGQGDHGPLAHDPLL